MSWTDGPVHTGAAKELRIDWMDELAIDDKVEPFLVIRLEVWNPAIEQALYDYSCVDFQTNAM